MNKSEYEVGQRVELIVSRPGYNKVLDKGDRGTIVKVIYNYLMIGYTLLCVNWDKHCRGHDCEGLCEDGFGWNVESEHVIPVYDYDDDSQELDIDTLLFEDYMSFKERV